MGSVEPTQEKISALAELPLEGPIVMLNLLRYRERASYPGDFDAEPCTGREAYARYTSVAQGLVEAQGGKVLWAGVMGEAALNEGDSDVDLVVSGMVDACAGRQLDRIPKPLDAPLARLLEQRPADPKILQLALRIGGPATKFNTA